MVVAVGQKIAYKDSSGKDIKVGDVVKTGQGEYWDINTYLQAVPRHAAMAIDVSKFVHQYPERHILTRSESEKVDKVLGVPEVAKVENLRRRRAKNATTKAEKKEMLHGVANGYKVCPHCKEMKPTSEFSKSAKNPDGLQAWCKQCVNNFYKEKGTSRRKK